MTDLVQFDGNRANGTEIAGFIVRADDLKSRIPKCRGPLSINLCKAFGVLIAMQNHRLLAVVLFGVAACSNEPAPDFINDSIAANTIYDPEMSGIVVTANPHATEAGVRVLEAGGSAIDAAVAIESVLSLVEPQSSGLGGGGFLLHFDAETKEIEVYDGRETAPSGATPEMFLDEEGESLPFIQAKNSGLSIGVPGMVSLLAMAQNDHGLLPWETLFDSAIELSEQGFDVSPRLADFLERFAQHIPSDVSDGPTDAYHYFYEADGTPKARLVNLAYADTLNSIKEDPSSFYRGSIAEQIVEQVSAMPRAGALSLEDIASYSALKIEPLCMPYKEVTLCGPQPPSSWLTVAQAMGILEHSPRFLEEGNLLRDWTMVGEALRMAYADRDQYVADPDYVQVPVAGILNSEYHQLLASQIDPDAAMEEVSYGDPWAFESNEVALYGLDATPDHAGTTHFGVVDAQGNAVAMTASVESIFGSTRMAGGMFLNNQLTDFSRVPVDESGMPIANAVEPSKRPRSSMSPTIVLDSDGEFLMSTGSPGGTSIISYTLKTLVAVLDWGMTPQEAVDLPNMVPRPEVVRIETSRASEELLQTLNDYGFPMRESAGENSGLSTILVNADGSFSAGVDPRREGTIGLATLSN